MGGEAFFLIKAGDSRPESSKQAEIRLAILLKILHIPPVLETEGLPGRAGTCNGCICSDFRWIWLIRRRAVDLLSRSQFLLRNWRSILHGSAGIRCYRYWVRILYIKLLKEPVTSAVKPSLYMRPRREMLPRSGIY
jgi:hypothetical protein